MEYIQDLVSVKLKTVFDIETQELETWQLVLFTKCGHKITVDIADIQSEKL